ncbi:MAG: hypothetical protein M3441_19855 [Chloroflexota bacterium]|nr:hypothetical protein [Chloroflexota bacterium]
MIFGNQSQSHIKRAGIITTLAVTMMVSLAACGGTPATPTPASQPTAQLTATTAGSGAVPPVGTAVVTALETAMPTAPAALATEGSDMGDMGDMGEMAEGTTTPAEPTAGTNAGSTATPAADQGTGGVNSVEVQGTLREWAIDLSQREVPAGKVTFTVTNEGQFAHNFAVEDTTGVIGKTPNFSKADGAQTLELELAPGTYNIICTLPGHASRGQQTTLVVK